MTQQEELFLVMQDQPISLKNNAGTWSELQKLVASDRGARDYFSSSVAISGDYLIVGAVLEDNDTTGGAFLNDAAAYIFKNSLLASLVVENSFEDDALVVYPNPTNGNFSIDLGAVYQSSEISIRDISGKLIDSRTIAQSQVLNLSLDQPAGIYIISVQAANKRAVIRLVKQ